jgi:hypothetical protein
MHEVKNLMNEPSVLDYVKAKLLFWKPSSIQIPREPEGVLGQEGSNPLEEIVQTEARVDGTAETGLEGQAPPPAIDRSPAISSSTSLNLLIIAAALSLALIAQGMVEPPNRGWQVSLIIYGFSAILIGAAYLRKLFTPTDIPEENQYSTNISFRFSWLVVSLICMLLTFMTFGRGEGDIPEFTLLNTSLWVLSVGFLVWTFWLPAAREGETVWNKIRRWAASPSWKINITRWSLLLLAVVALALFFRFYRLQNVPAEMVSDHAEKLLDVSDVMNGEFRVFFPRNTGREAFQFYWTALMVSVFHTGISFMALKLGTVICGVITLIYMYRLGKEIGNPWVALFAVLFTGFSYWANIQSRIGLRFPLYPFFFAPTLFHLLRALRQGNRNDFILAGLWLGAGLHGYTSFRIVPFVVAAGIVIYLLHTRSREKKEYAFWGLLIIALVSLAVLMPLFRFAIDRPDLIAYRSLTRLGDLERPLPGPAWQIFIQNTWSALVMFFWDDGDVWVHSVVHRPAMDVISAAVFFIGLVLVVLRYIRKRDWVDLFLLVSIPLLLLPSILSLAFPNENPNLNRTAGAYVPAFLILAIGFDALLSSIRRSLSGKLGLTVAWVLGLTLVAISASNNYDLLFVQYDASLRGNGWNSSEMGSVIHEFAQSIGNGQDAWVVAYPYWVDTRLVGINAGYPTRDTGIDPADLTTTVDNPRAKLFLLHPQDSTGLGTLIQLYPEGRYWTYTSRTPGKDFIIYLVLPRENMLPSKTSTTP